MKDGSIVIDESEIDRAFHDFIYSETGWKIISMDGSYYGKTAERYTAFKAGYIRGKK